MAIVVKDSKGNWIQATQAEYKDESELQELLFAAPELLDDLDDGSLVFTREASLSESACADLVGVRADGSLLLIETKLARNPEIRRKVTGQILEYASLLWQTSFETLDGFFRRNGQPSLYEQVLRRAGVDATLSEFPTAQEFHAAITQALKAGQFKLLIVVDAVTPELERVIAYIANLGSGMGLEALAVRKHILGEQAGLVLQRYGSPQASPAASSPSRKLTVQEVIARAENESMRRKLQSPIDGWNQQGDSVDAGTSGVSCRSLINGLKMSFFWATPTDVWGIQPQFKHLEQHGLPSDVASWFRREIGSLPGFDLERCLQKSYPTTKFSAVDENTLGQFLHIMHECVTRWKASIRSALWLTIYSEV